MIRPKQDTRAKERSHVYGLLSRIYSRELTQDFLKGFRNPGSLKLFEELGINLGKDFENRIPEELVNQLAIEYTRLFIGPGKHIYPYESAYKHQSGNRAPNRANQIKHLIESCGLRYQPDFRQQFDHISIELEFMERITEEEAGTWKRRDYQKAVELLEFERHFLDEHLVKWIPEFADRVIKQADLSFYREMAKLTKRYILLELRQIKALIRQVLKGGIKK